MIENSTRYEGVTQRLAKGKRMSQRDGPTISPYADRDRHPSPAAAPLQKNRSHRYRWLITIEPNVTGRPKSENRQKLIGYPARLAISTITTLAEAPMIVPLPPRQAPSASAHQIGMTSG